MSQPTTTRHRLLYLLPVLVFLALALWFWRGLAPDRDPSLVPSVMIEKEVPRFDLPALAAGKPGLKSEDLKGHLTLINFFASWCVPCRAEHPLLLDLAKDKRIRIDGIAWKNAPEDAAGFLADLGDPYALTAADQSGRTGIDFGVYGVPESYLIDQEGRIRYRKVGPFTEDDIQKKLMPLVTELSK
jgi:cytochrome c biogenesis protein CcmG, thiol:disulfide interchange protein DsbE